MKIFYKIFFPFLICTLFFCAVNSQTKNLFNAKPFLGWNSWDSYGMYPTQAAMLANLEVMAKKLKPFGYQYFVIDAGWNKIKNAEGKIIGMSVSDESLYIPNTPTFPQGIKVIADKAHSLGLKFGIHIMRGISRQAYKNNTVIKGTKYTAKDIADTTSLCRWNSDNYGVNMKKPGAQEYYNAYLKQLIDWGVDFIKADDITGHPDEIDAVVTAIKLTGKPVVLSLSPGGDTKVENITAYQKANMLRVTRDIWDNKEGIERAFTAWKIWSVIDKKNFWLDMDMISFGHLCLQNHNENYLIAIPDNKRGAEQSEHMSFLSPDQKNTFITIRALSASPLFMGGDLPTTDEFSFTLITNKGMLACNQNGITGKLIYEKDGFEIWKTINKSDPDQGWFGIFNRSSQLNNFQLTPDVLGFTNNTEIFDIWNKKNLGNLTKNNFITASINASGVLFCRFQIKK